MFLNKYYINARFRCSNNAYARPYMNGPAARLRPPHPDRITRALALLRNLAVASSPSLRNNTVSARARALWHAPRDELLLSEGACPQLHVAIRECVCTRIRTVAAAVVAVVAAAAVLVQNMHKLCVRTHTHIRCELASSMRAVAVRVSTSACVYTDIMCVEL